MRKAILFHERNWPVMGPLLMPLAQSRLKIRSMSKEDLSAPKIQDRERIVKAIAALKAKGAEVTPYTVADQAQIPRSTLYRNPELMDLINEEAVEGSEAKVLSNDDAAKRIVELEELNAELRETIWNLEQQIEGLSKLQQDARRLGFQAGLEEATKKLSGAGAAPVVGNAEEHDPLKSRRDTGPLEPIPPPDQVAAMPLLDPMAILDALNPESDLNSVASHDQPSNGDQGESMAPGSSKIPVSGDSTGDFEPISTAYKFGLQTESTYANTFDFGADSLTGSEPDLSAISAKSQPQPHPEHSEQSFAQVPEAQPAKSEGARDSAHSLADVGSSVSSADYAHDSTHDSIRALRDPDSIYNIARSGPTMSASTYNPLVELSWKDLETVYNFSVASLKDYAKQPAGETSGAMGRVNFADSSTQQPAPSRLDDGIAQPSTDDPRKTGDRLQAISDPRNFLDSENVVDLDSLDIFDDLDDYVDLDKIEIINDVTVKPSLTEEEMAAAGDDLRELIKGRIKQAADIPHEPAAPRTTAPPPAGGAAAKEDAAKPGPRNKFVGGAKAGQEPVPQQVFVKSIPPEIRKACMILGIKPEEATQRAVIVAWKEQIASPGVHPDLGGDTEAAVFLNTAKDTLVRWLDAQAPKLGKKFGKKDDEK